MIVDEKYLEKLRKRREKECFPIVDRGPLWYDRLSIEQINELEDWYQAWLDVTETGVVPAVPSWVNDKFVKESEEILI